MDNPYIFNIDNLNEYREGNQLEVKSAKGGLPASLWESYSAFANTEEGIIILGAKEKKDGSIYVEGLDDAAKMEKDFWNMANNRQKVSCNVLTNSMVNAEVVDGKEVLVIRVPRAERTVKPVYVGTDPRSGTYRRNGEGDYHCTRDEVSLMMRDALLVTEDNKVLPHIHYSAFDKETIRRYRQSFRLLHHNHTWNQEDDEMFLRRIGAMREDPQTGKFHPTGAGLLMFGYEYEILNEFPNYFLDYQENRTQSIYARWTDRVTSQSGDWSGNVFDFLLKVLPKLTADLKVPFVLKGNQREDDTPLHKVLREAMVNMLTNADFYGRRGVVVHKGEDGFKFANPGSMRVPLRSALVNNESAPRNGAMLRMLSFLEFGERAGSGLQGIFHTWETVFHNKPDIKSTSEGVDRTVLSLDFKDQQPDIKAMLTLYDDPDSVVLKSKDIQNPSKKEKSNLENDKSSLESNKSNPENVTSNLENDKSSLEDGKSSLEKDNSNLENTKSTREDKGETNRDRVLNHLRHDDNLTLPKLAEKIGLSLAGVKKIVKDLKSEGVLKHEGPTKKGRWIVMM